MEPAGQGCNCSCAHLSVHVSEFCRTNTFACLLNNHYKKPYEINKPLIKKKILSLCPNWHGSMVLHGIRESCYYAEDLALSCFEERKENMRNIPTPRVRQKWLPQIERLWVESVSSLVKGLCSQFAWREKRHGSLFFCITFTPLWPLCLVYYEKHWPSFGFLLLHLQHWHYHNETTPSPANQIKISIWANMAESSIDLGSLFTKSYTLNHKCCILCISPSKEHFPPFTSCSYQDFSGLFFVSKGQGLPRGRVGGH